MEGLLSTAGRWGRRTVWAAWAACAAYWAWELLRAAFERPQGEGDTAVLLRGAYIAYRCLKDVPLRPCPQVQHFPLLQYVPSVTLYAAHWNIDQIAALLSHVTVVCFALVLALTAWAWRASRPGPVMGALCVLCTYGTWYYQSTFGETLAGALTLGLVCSVWWGRSALLSFALMVGAGISKEVAAPFLLLMSVLPLMARSSGLRALLRENVRMLIALGAGAVGAVAANCAFNVFRFGTITNTFLLQPVLTVPELHQQLLNFAGLWVSPNGGLVLFAIPLVVLLFGIAGQVCVAVIRHQRTRWSALPLAGIVFAWLGLTIGLSRWFSPFGWWAWGPRLCWPWIPASVALLGALYPAEVDRIFAPVLARRWTFALGAAALAFIAVPHLVMERTADVWRPFFQWNPECHGDPDVLRNVRDYYDCSNRMMFPHQVFVLPRVYAISLREDLIGITLSYAGTVLGLAALVRRRFTRAVGFGASGALASSPGGGADVLERDKGAQGLSESA